MQMLLSRAFPFDPKTRADFGECSAVDVSPSSEDPMAATLVGLVLGLLIGAGCRYFDMPSPAPPRLIGAFMLVAMTLGFVVAGYIL